MTDSSSSNALPRSNLPSDEYERFEQLFENDYRKLVAYMLWLGVSREMAHDIVSEAISRTWKAEANGAEIENLYGYVLTTARNVLLEFARRNQKEVVNLDQPELLDGAHFVLSDEETVRQFDDVATVADVHAVLKRVFESGDRTIFRVAILMLDKIQKTGKVPSAREIGRDLGLSHTGVSKAIERLRRYFAAVRSEVGRA